MVIDVDVGHPEDDQRWDRVRAPSNVPSTSNNTAGERVVFIRLCSFVVRWPRFGWLGRGDRRAGRVHGSQPLRNFHR